MRRLVADELSDSMTEALVHDKADIMQVFMNMGLDVNFQNRSGQMCLMQAIKFLSSNTAGVLLDAGADVYIRDDNGMTANEHDQIR